MSALVLVSFVLFCSQWILFWCSYSFTVSLFLFNFPFFVKFRVAEWGGFFKVFKDVWEGGLLGNSLVRAFFFLVEEELAASKG